MAFGMHRSAARRQRFIFTGGVLLDKLASLCAQQDAIVSMIGSTIGGYNNVAVLRPRNGRRKNPAQPLLLGLGSVAPRLSPVGID